MNQYISEIDYWINFSNSNNVNKIRKFVATDKAFNTSLYEIIKSRDLNIKINEEEFNLLEGFVEDETSVEISLFNAEKALYKNFQAILQKTELSVSDLLN
jgi:cell division ATPase FtsA